MGTSERSSRSSADRRYGGALSALAAGVGDVVRSRRRAEGRRGGSRPARGGNRPGRDEHMEGAWCLVTGASSGLGFEAAVRLLDRGANLIVASRSAGPDLVRRLRKRVGARAGAADPGADAAAAPGSDPASRDEPVIEAVPVDLASLASVAELVDELVRRGHRLDVVVLNAGLVRAQNRTTADGFDEMLQVNYLANHALATRLVSRGCVRFPGGSDAVRPPRFVVVSSEAHRSAPDVPTGAPFAVGAYGMRESMRWYGYSKLLLTTFTEELARRHPLDGEQPLTVLTMCPGAMSTSIARDAPQVLQPLIRLVFRLFFPDPERSAETLVHLASSPELDRATGRYYHLGGEKAKDARAYDRKLAARLWDETERAVSAALEDHAKERPDG
ncbi:MAG: SDR family NAD(P)-dependent oxidoreductase [bacterium]